MNVFLFPVITRNRYNYADASTAAAKANKIKNNAKKNQKSPIELTILKIAPMAATNKKAATKAMRKV